MGSTKDLIFLRPTLMCDKVEVDDRMRYLLAAPDLRPNVGVGRVQGAARREAAKDVQVKLGRVTKKL